MVAGVSSIARNWEVPCSSVLVALVLPRLVGIVPPIVAGEYRTATNATTPRRDRKLRIFNSF